MQTYPTGYAESHHIAEQIFREILPRHGMAVREEQIALCHEVLDTLYNKEISLCEAGVGTGKTLAYLVGCILWQMNRPERMKLPIVISTSSVALQDAILTEYLPDLSAVLLDEGIIALPELDADAIIDKILRRAELQFNYCAAGDDDPTTMQIKRACKEFKPTDTFPESFYSSIVSKIILHLDTHIDIKLRNGQTL